MLIMGLHLQPLGVIMLISLVESRNLVLHPVGDHSSNSLVVLDMDTGRAFCYPSIEEITSIQHEHLPMRQRDHGLDPLHEITQLHNNARVICREVGDYTHLERVYSVPAPKDLPATTKRVKWFAECLGYEPLASHCFTFNVSKEDSRCDQLLGLECGYCSKKFDLDIGRKKVIVSPEYPEYSDDVLCKWSIETPVPAVFEISFKDLKLPPRNDEGNCHRGSLEIRSYQEEGEENSAVEVVEEMCGSGIPDAVMVSGRGVVIRFSAGVFYPRPIGEDAGFNLTVSAIEAAVIPKEEIPILTTGQIMAVVFGGLLLLVVCLFVFYILRRHQKDRERSMQRRLMQERLATQRQGRQDAALTAMLAANLRTLGMPPGHPGTPLSRVQSDHNSRRGEPPDDFHKEPVNRRNTKKTSFHNDQPSRTISFPNFPPTPPPPPPPPHQHSVSVKERPRLSSSSAKKSCDTYEEPIYVEASQLEKSFSYIQLDDIKNAATPPLRKHIMPSPPSSVSSMTHPKFCNQTVTNFGLNNQIANNLDLTSRSPFDRPHEELGTSNRDKAFASFSMWSSSSTLPRSPPMNKNLNMNLVLNSWDKSPIGSSLSLHSGTVFSFPGNSPDGVFFSKADGGPPLSNTTLGDIANIPCPVRQMSLGKNRNLSAWRKFSDSPPVKILEPDAASVNSNESVFTSGENVAQDQCIGENRNDCTCENCPQFKYQHYLTSTIKQCHGHLSKSCGDVSPASAYIQHDPILDDIHQSAPSLPRNQSEAVKPLLRRVSQVFPGSESLYYASVTELGKNVDPKNFLDGTKSVKESKSTEKNIVEAKGSSSRKLGGKTISELSIRKERVSLPTSPRRSTVSSLSSASYHKYKYNRLDKTNNADCDALIPSSSLPDSPEFINSPGKEVGET